ncbi:hypothetical protein Tco_0644000, partial [Tanacetum coccineum]
VISEFCEKKGIKKEFNVARTLQQNGVAERRILRRIRVRMRMMRERESQGLDDEGQGLDDEGQGLDDEGQGLEDEGPGIEEAAPEGQQQAVPVVDTAMSEPLGLEYEAAKRHTLESTEEIAPSTYETLPSPEWSLGSLPVSPSSPVVPSPIASSVATPSTTISVDEDQFLERVALWHAIYDIQRENHDLRRQLAKERRERLELIDHVTRIEKRQEFRGE